MMIALENVTYTYPATRKPVLKDLSLLIEQGEFCAVVGANLAGKSTLCNTVAGFIPHFYRGTLEGSVQVAGHDVTETPLSELTGDIGLVFQNPFNQITGARFSVREEIAFGLENLGVPLDEMMHRVDEILSLTGLEALAHRSPMNLSGGQQQRLALASVIVMQPKVLVLDEPTSQLDPVGTREVFSALADLVKAYDMTVLLTSHKLEWIANFTDRVVMLADGRVVMDGSPGEVLTSELMIGHNIGQTRYTQAARTAVEQGLVPEGKPLPVTLEEAIDFFSS